MFSLYFSACLRHSLSYLQRVFAGRVSRGQRHAHQARDTADSCYDTVTLVNHVPQDVLGDRDCSQEVELHQTAENIDLSVDKERALTPPTVIHQHVYLQC